MLISLDWLHGDGLFAFGGQQDIIISNAELLSD